MKKIIYLLLFQTLLQTMVAQQNPIRLIIRGDDMGASHSENVALIKSYKDGIETTIEVLVVSPWFPEAVKLINQNPGVDIGLHLALTSEWENVKWRPLTDCRSLKDSNGYFFPMITPNKNYPLQSISENQWKIQDIEMEFRAQIEMALKRIPRISHLSSHMGCTHLTAEVSALTKRLGQEYHIPVEGDLKFDEMVGYNGPHQTSEEKIKSFLAMLNRLEPGKTYIFLDHPGINDEELRAIYHIGYEGVAEDRQGVTDVFTNDQVKALIQQKGIQRIGYKDLLKK